MSTFLHKFSSISLSKSDLKPANIGFDRLKRIKIFDFGLAEQVRNGTCRGRVGTLRYMAPEVAKNEGPYGLSADIFSFAVLLWQIVTSRIPFDDEISAFSEPAFIPDDVRPPLKYIDLEPLQTLCKSGWTPNPDDRPTFEEIGLELEKIMVLPPKPSGKKVGKQKQRKPKMLRSIFQR